MDGPILAVDVGGTKFAVGVLSPAGAILAAREVATPWGPDVDAERLWSLLLDMVEHVLAGAAPAGVGVGCGGPMRWPDGIVSPLNLPAWKEFPLRARLAERFPGGPVRLHNDAVCIAAAEHWLGSGRGYDSLLGMVVSTGVGGGLISAGRVIDGATGNAGHVGHVVVVPGGRPCGCGGRGCVEAECRGPRIAEWAVREGWRPPTGTEVRPSARDLAASARAGDSIAIEAFARAGRLLGLGIASAVAVTDVSLVAIGGGVAQAGPLLFEPLRSSYREHARIHFARGVTIGPATLGPEAGLVGAAALVAAGDRYWSAD